MKEGLDMKNWKILCITCLAASLLFACSNTEDKTGDSKKTEAFTTETAKNTDANLPETTDSTVTIAGQKMTDTEQQKITDFIEKYPVEYSNAIETGDFTTLANEYIMHETKLYEHLLNEVEQQHKDGTTQKINKIEISKINRLSDTDFTVDTKETIEETKNGKNKSILRVRQYKLYYDYVEGDDSNSFFKIMDIKDLK